MPVPAGVFYLQRHPMENQAGQAAPTLLRALPGGRIGVTMRVTPRESHGKIPRGAPRF